MQIKPRRAEQPGREEMNTEKRTWPKEVRAIATRERRNVMNKTESSTPTRMTCRKVNLAPMGRLVWENKPGKGITQQEARLV